MVHRTSISEIQKYISEKKLRPMKKWSNRFLKSQPGYKKSWYIKRLANQMRHIFNILSGNDLIQMIKSTIFWHLIY
jgi:hypothetical protein